MVKNMPLGVKILSVLYYIGAVLLLIAGIVLISGSTALLDYIPLMTGFVAFAGAFFIVFAILYFFLGRGLWKGQNWARIVTLVLIVISAISSLSSIAVSTGSSIFSLAVDCLIIWYLGFKPNVKKAFS